jgi:hypothetical protein
VITLKKIEDRIEELGGKSTQLLLFRSFSFVAVVTLMSDHALAGTQKHALTVALRLWVWALLPVLVGIAPLKELGWENPRWYRHDSGYFGSWSQGVSASPYWQNLYDHRFGAGRLRETLGVCSNIFPHGFQRWS